jgi:hypothetical protein
MFSITVYSCAGKAGGGARMRLARNPRAFDGKLLRVRGTLNVEFEDFSLGIRNCETKQDIWLAFGGDVPGIVASTMNDSFRQPVLTSQ